jgi:eukaryotic-like serine/threonine-protein kinase
MDRRRHARTPLDSPAIGLLRSEGAGYVAGTTLVDHPQTFFVDLLDRSSGGARLKSTIEIELGTSFQLTVFNSDSKAWDRFDGSAVWMMQAIFGKASYFLIGASLLPYKSQASQGRTDISAEKKIPFEGDYEFFRETELLRFLPRDAVVTLINNVFHRKVKAGDRFITQGEPGDACYLIQHGTCVARVEGAGRLKTVARLREGSIVGEMALLTGEPRSAHVFAETDMALWGLTRAQYDSLVPQFPELRTFLTTVLTRWFDTRKVIAERQIGKYSLTDVLGQGAFALVYKGRHRDLNMPVAIKMMRHDMAMEPDFVDGFRKEAQTIAGFSHENIVKIHDIEEKYRTVFIIMEYLEGRTLRQVLDIMLRLPPKKVVKYVRQICNGLDYAHRRGIVHMDIKPGNIFVLPDDNVKIVDFGLACTCGTETLMAGTPFYMAPEQIECLPVDIRADIFALGIMTYEMVAGERPFSEKDAWKVMDLHVTQDIPDPAETAADVPEPLRNMIIKACAREPARRYQNVAQILEDLSPLAEVFDLAGPSESLEGNKTTTMCILHKDEHQTALNQLIQKFKRQLEEKGMALKITDF